MDAILMRTPKYNIVQYQARIHKPAAIVSARRSMLESVFHHLPGFAVWK